MCTTNFRKGFTLVEIMVVIAIAMILGTMSIAPYNFYTSQSRVKNAYEKVGQALSSARSLVQGGVIDNQTKKSGSIGIWVEKWTSAFPLFVYPFDAGTGAYAYANKNTYALVQTIPLDDKVSISALAPNVDKLLILFRAPSAKIAFYSESGDILSLSGVSITTGLAGALSGALAKTFYFVP